jgi:hypothetical protein
MENFQAMELFVAAWLLPICRSGKMQLNAAAPQCVPVTIQTLARIASNGYWHHGFITLTRFSLVRIGLGRCI